MTIPELSILVGFIVTIATVGATYGALRNQVSNLTKRLDKFDDLQVAKDKNGHDWQLGEAKRMKDNRHEMLESCQEQFIVINNKLSGIEGQLASLNLLFGRKDKT